MAMVRLAFPPDHCVEVPLKRLSSIAQAPKGISKEGENALLKEACKV